jgi:murein DD-endopeptidase MepM/ murein hydrolase activator NlpD
MYSSLGLKGHQGIDFESPSGTKLYAPCDGLAQYVTDEYHGDGLWIYNTSEGANHIVILYHLYPKENKEFPFQVPTDGTKNLVKAGDFLGYTDNSGAPMESNGPHLHIGVIPCDPDWNRLEPDNGFRGCVSPLPFFNNLYAEDISISTQVVEKATRVVNLVSNADIPHQAKLDVWEKVAQFLQELLSKL